MYIFPRPPKYRVVHRWASRDLGRKDETSTTEAVAAPAARSGLSDATSPESPSSSGPSAQFQAVEYLELLAAAISALVRGNARATATVNQIIRTRIDRVLQAAESVPSVAELVGSETILFARTCLLEDELWPQRVAVLLEILHKALRAPPLVALAERVLLPCLLVLRRLCTVAGGPDVPAEVVTPRLDPDGQRQLERWLSTAEAAANRAVRVAVPSTADGERPVTAGGATVRGPTTQPTATADALARRYLRRWRRRVTKRTQPRGADGDAGRHAGDMVAAMQSAAAWLPQLLLASQAEAVRVETVALIQYAPTRPQTICMDGTAGILLTTTGCPVLFGALQAAGRGTSCTRPHSGPVASDAAIGVEDRPPLNRFLRTLPRHGYGQRRQAPPNRSRYVFQLGRLVVAMLPWLNPGIV